MPLPLKDFPRSGEDVAQRQKRGQGVTEGDGEGAPAPLRGAAAAAAEGPSNRRSEKKVQRRRPPPAADTGRSCWGSGQQDTSAAQGTKWTLGTATRLSEAVRFFPVRLPLWGLKGASSPFLVGPARRNRRALAALNTRHLLRKPVCSLKAPLGLSCPPGTAVLSGSLLCGKREQSPPGETLSQNISHFL